MAKKNKKGRLLIIIGTVLLSAALSLVFYNNYRQRKSNESMQSVLDDVKAQIVINTQSSANDDNIPGESKPDSFAPPSHNHNNNSNQSTQEEQTVVVEEKEYIGVLSVPAINLELPVMSDWSYDDLYITACRYSGSIAEGNIIIAAHNYRYFFGPIDNLNSGDRISFTAVDGTVYNFEVSQSELVDGSDSASMKAGSDDWDLTLFTCTWSGTSRLAVRAHLITE